MEHLTKLFSLLLLSISVLAGCSTKDTTSFAPSHTYDTQWTYDANTHWHNALDGSGAKGNEDKHSFESVVTEPTYNSGGFTTHTCTVCGYSYESDETDKLEHSYSDEWTFNDFEHWHKCTDQGFDGWYVDKENHTIVLKEVVNPTYEEKGYTIYKCSVCTYEYKDDYVNKLDHHWTHVYDDNYHWNQCTDQGYEDLISEKEEHNKHYIHHGATYESGAYFAWSCTGCDWTDITDDEDEPILIRVIFKDYYGNTIYDNPYFTYGNTPYFTGSEPTKPEDDDNWYNFVGWSPALAPVYYSTTYTPVFEAVPKYREIQNDDWYHKHYTSQTEYVLEEHNYDGGHLVSEESCYLFTCQDCGHEFKESMWLFTDGNVTFQNGKATITGAIAATPKTMMIIPAELNGFPLNSSFGSSQTFELNRHLTHIYLPNVVTEINSNTFVNFSSLEKIRLSDNVTNIGSFSGCTSLEDFDLPTSLSELTICCFQNCDSLCNMSIPEGITEIPSSAFISCDSLENVSLPSTITKIYKQSFALCPSLTSITYNGTIYNWQHDVQKNVGTYSDWEWNHSSPISVIHCTDGDLPVSS